MSFLPETFCLVCNCNNSAPSGDLAKTFKEKGMAKTDSEAAAMLAEMQCANGVCTMREASSTAPLQPVCVLSQIWTADRLSSQMMTMCTYYPSVLKEGRKESCMNNTEGNQTGGTKLRFCTTDKCNNKIECANNAAIMTLSITVWAVFVFFCLAGLQ